MLSGKKVVITGGAGFIGTSLAQRLVDENQVVLFDNFHRNALKGSDLERHANLRVIEGDVLDAKGLRAACRGANQIIHMASIAGVDTVMNHPVKTMRVSLLGTMNALEAAFELDGLERFVDFSTSEVFGRYAYKVTEGDVSQLGVVGEARWTYAVSKLATEHLALSYWKESKLPACSIRPFNIYGPRQVGEGAVHHFIVRALRGEDLVVHNDGSQIRSWCYIDDIVDGVVLAMSNHQAIGNTFNIGNPRATVTIYNLAEQIIRITGSKSRLRQVEWNFPDVELRIPHIGKARELLGFEPKFGLEEGLERTVEWYRALLR